MSARNNIPTSVPADIFTPTEHAILADFLNVAAPVNTPAIDELLYDHREDSPEGEGVGLLPDSDGEEGHWLAVSNAVARLALSGIQSRLPQWGAVDAEGNVTLGRDVPERSPGKDRIVSLMPRHLFTINWADTAPGICWPEAYHVCFIPYYDVWVVTGSVDSTDSYAYCDRTIGWFEAERDTAEGAKEIIQGDWQEQKDRGDQPRWEDLFYQGLIGTDEAYLLADEVWPPDDSENLNPELPPAGNGSFRDQIVADIQKKFPNMTEEEIIEEAGGLI